MTTSNEKKNKTDGWSVGRPCERAASWEEQALLTSRET